MKNLLLASVLSLCFGLCALGDDSPLFYHTDGQLNGRAWAVFTAYEKRTYIWGAYDALQFANAANSPGAVGLPGNPGRQPDIVIDGLTAQEVAKVVDGFYSDAANVRVPVFWTLIWAKRKVAGDSVADLDKMAAQFRAVFADKGSR